MNRLLILLFGYFMFSCQSSNHPNITSAKEVIIPSELNVTKLIVEGKNRTNELGSIRISANQWSEYNRAGEVIGVGQILSVTNHEFEVKWTLAENGATIGEKTKYDYHILDDKVLFTIWFDNLQRGYFEANVKERQ